MKRIQSCVFLGILVWGAALADADRGDTRIAVLTKMGKPAAQETTFFGRSCPSGQRQDTWYYPPRDGNMSRTVIFCNDQVVEIQYGK